jgi:hypothetical protein
LPTVKVSE